MRVITQTMSMKLWSHDPGQTILSVALWKCGPLNNTPFDALQVLHYYRTRFTRQRQVLAPRYITILQTYELIQMPEHGTLTPWWSTAVSLSNEELAQILFFMCPAMQLLAPGVTVTDVPDRIRVVYFNKPVSDKGFFGQSINQLMPSRQKMN